MTREEQQARLRAYYLANREKVIARANAHAAANREKVLAYKKEHWAKNRDRYRAMKRDHYAANRVAVLAQQKAAYRANPEPKRLAAKLNREARREYYLQYFRAYGKRYRADPKNRTKIRAKDQRWALANPEKYRELRGRRRARERATRSERIDFKAILKAFDGFCGICREPLDPSVQQYHFDHVIPLAASGTHTQGNIQIAHAKCNLVKGAKVA